MHIKKQFHPLTYSGDIGYSRILRSDCLREDRDVPDYILLKSLKQYHVSLGIYQQKFTISTFTPILELLLIYHLEVIWE